MKIEYNPEVSLGALLQIGTVVSAVFAAYVALSVKDAQHDAAIAAHDKEIARIEYDHKQIQTDVKETVKEIGKDVKQLDHKITSILVDRAGVARELASKSK